MRFQFVYPDLWSLDGEVQLGVGTLSAVLKENGHKVNLIHLKSKDILTMENKVKMGIKKFKPDVIGFSITEFGYPVLKQLSRIIKTEFEIPIIAGGSYPTLYPNDVISLPEVDMITRGESEGALLQLVNNIEKGKPIKNIKNVWVKEHGKVHKNSIGPLQDIENLPFPDRSIFDEETVVGKETKMGGLKTINMMCSRGCPFGCSYCINTHLRGLYPNPGNYVRFKTVDKVIDEIRFLQKNYKFDSIVFHDDTMLLNKKWILEFSKKYKKEIGLPFCVNSRPETCTEDLVKSISNAGCILVLIGVESGNERIRKMILKRFNTNKQIEDAFDLVKKYSMGTSSFNMIGLPFETEKNIKETIKLNLKINPDFIQTSIFYPFRGTELGEICYRKGWVDLEKKERATNYFSESILNYPNLNAKKIKYYHQLFGRSINLKKKEYVRYLFSYLPPKLQVVISKTKRVVRG